MNYRVSLESYEKTYTELYALYEAAFTEIANRLKEDGVVLAPFNPLVSEYINLERTGGLLTYVLRDAAGEAKGFCTVYLANDMRNGELMAQEDAIYIMPECRTGVGKTLVRCILMDLQKRGVRRVIISALDAFGVAKIWRRIGFRDLATQLIYSFD